MKQILSLIAICIILKTNAQNLYPKRLDNCITSVFCLDCGDDKADVDKEKFAQMITYLNSQNNLNGITGRILFQILVDSTGKGCVLSHTDVSDNIISKNIIASLNNFTGFIPAKTGNKNEERTSFDISFQIEEGKIIAKIERVDMKAFMASFDKPKDPEIYNKEYVYKNENLKNYKITVWNSRNSNLPNNMNDHISIDKKGIVWLTVDEGLVKFDGIRFDNMEQNITDKGKFFSYYDIETDNENVKWVYGTNGVYSYKNKKWKKYDPKEIGIDGGNKIINNLKTSEVFFCTDKGLTILKNGKWSKMDKEVIKEMPSNRVLFAKRDSKGRIWMGTSGGSILIDEQEKVISFNATETVLKDKCITSMDEDENGNIYLGLFEFDRKDHAIINNNEGFAIYSLDGTLKQFTTSNSGMPFNHVTKLLYDKKEKILWLATDRAGLVRYNLKGKWENYHSKNSLIPTSYISDMTFDVSGNLYLATRQGLVKIERQ